MQSYQKNCLSSSVYLSLIKLHEEHFYAVLARNYSLNLMLIFINFIQMRS